jgi:hypothetical protein
MISPLLAKQAVEESAYQGGSADSVRLLLFLCGRFGRAAFLSLAVPAFGFLIRYELLGSVPYCVKSSQADFSIKNRFGDFVLPAKFGDAINNCLHGFLLWS